MFFVFAARLFFVAARLGSSSWRLFFVAALVFFVVARFFLVAARLGSALVRGGSSQFFVAARLGSALVRGGSFPWRLSSSPCRLCCLLVFSVSAVLPSGLFRGDSPPFWSFPWRLSSLLVFFVAASCLLRGVFSSCCWLLPFSWWLLLFLFLPLFFVAASAFPSAVASASM